MRVTFLGHAAFFVETPHLRALIDPFLSENPQASRRPEDFQALDHIFVTHGHWDHVGDAVALAQRTGATIVCCSELARVFSRKDVHVFSRHIGGRATFPFGRVKMTPALHGGGVSGESPTVCGGHPGGFLLEVDGKKLYHAGDTGLSMEMTLLGEEGIDLALLPIGGTYTMDVEDAVRAVKLLKPRVVVPMHYGTFPPIAAADPWDFAARARDLAQVVVLAPGESLNLGS